MTNEDIDVIEEKMPELDFDLRTDYSGRGMYGSTTMGIVVGRYDLEDVESFLKEEGISYRLDNMGLDYILY